MIIQLNNIGEGLFSTEKRKFTSTQKADELLSCNAYPGDIIVSKMMPAGRACILPDLYSRYVMGSDAIRVKVDGEKYSNTFICAQINTTRCHKWIDGRTGGSTRQRIGLPVLKELPLYFPTIAEQKTISFFLNLLDKRIQTQNKIIEDLISIEKLIIDHVFGQQATDSLSAFISEINERNKAEEPLDVYSVSNRLGFIPQSEQFEDKEIASNNKQHYKIATNSTFAYNPARINVGSIGFYSGRKPVIVSPMYVCFKVHGIDPLVLQQFFFLEGVL